MAVTRLDYCIFIFSKIVFLLFFFKFSLAKIVWFHSKISAFATLQCLAAAPLHFAPALVRYQTFSSFFSLSTSLGELLFFYRLSSRSVVGLFDPRFFRISTFRTKTWSTCNNQFLRLNSLDQ